MSDFFTINQFTSGDVIYFIHKIFCLTRNCLLFQYQKHFRKQYPKKLIYERSNISLNTCITIVWPLFFARIRFIQSKTGFSLVPPHVMFSPYEIIQKNGGLLKSQTDVIIQKCRSKASLDSYAKQNTKVNIAHCTPITLIGRKNDVITLHMCFHFFIFNIFIEKMHSK